MESHRFDSADFVKGLLKAEVELLAAVSQSLGQAAAHAAMLARNTTNFKDHTGNLRSSITRGQKGPWVHFVRAGGPKAKYAYFVENGTQPHPITPKRKGGVLRFVIGGHIFFRTKVMHKGTKARHFLQEAAEYAEHTLIRFIEAGALRAFQ